MEHTEIKLNKKSIYSTQSGKHYVEMLYPDGWSISIKENRESYGGYPYPYTFRIGLRNPENTALINYFSPRRYIDDHLLSFRNNQTDEYGNLLHAFETLDEYLGKWAANDMKDFENVTYQGAIEVPNMEQLEADRKQQALKKAQDNGRQLNWYYYKKMGQKYSYTYKGVERMKVYAGIIEAEDVSRWSPVPTGGFMMDPFMQNAMQSVFQDMHYDKNTGSYVRLTENETGWSARQLFTLDCMARDYDYYYKNIFLPIRNEGVVIHDEIWNEYAQIKKEMDAKRQKAREGKRAAAKAKQEADAQRRESQRRFYEDIRKTQQETHDIMRSAYDNQRKSQAKVREIWGDANQGNTRFVDKYGDEHVIHTYDNYAYKNGDTYVTSNDPLDHSYDWEELEKKKY
ncbi:MAG: hypothetical protein IKS51_08620 [Erysipelotrichaceae bacterium]|nr:hypothetical protein [Erysipelotrichaceae bacterium]